jgi:hypothetical protein
VFVLITGDDSIPEDGNPVAGPPNIQRLIIHGEELLHLTVAVRTWVSTNEVLQILSALRHEAALGGDESVTAAGHDAKE